MSAPIANSPPPPGRSGPPPTPHLFRFGLRQMLLLVSLATILAGLMAKLGGVWPWVIGGSVAMVAAHVFGTLIGTRLRDTSREVQDWRAAVDPKAVDEPAISRDKAPRDARARTTSLADRHAAPQRDRWAIGGGAAVGTLLGVVAISLGWGDRVSLLAILVGAISCAVLGGWLALVATSFAAIARHALRHASEDHQQDQDRRRAAFERRHGTSPRPQRR
ncbi:MAG: hypothetical protein CMJ58_08930 [Planctomycetaceae bacterium]|nr:hypothetical protein [Planctomycetaceae bacterium]